MTFELRQVDGKEVWVICEYCPICGEYTERPEDEPNTYLLGRDCGH